MTLLRALAFTSALQSWTRGARRRSHWTGRPVPGLFTASVRPATCRVYARQGSRQRTARSTRVLPRRDAKRPLPRWAHLLFVSRVPLPNVFHAEDGASVPSGFLVSAALPALLGHPVFSLTYLAFLMLASAVGAPESAAALLSALSYLVGYGALRDLLDSLAGTGAADSFALLRATLAAFALFAGTLSTEYLLPHAAGSMRQADTLLDQLQTGRHREGLPEGQRDGAAAEDLATFDERLRQLDRRRVPNEGGDDTGSRAEDRRR